MDRGEPERLLEGYREGAQVIVLPDTGAVFNDDRTRRYWLGRKLEVDSQRRALFIALNPSTADENANDPTIAKEIRLATRWGYGYLDKVNVYDWRATDPKELKHVVEPVSPENECYILAAAERAASSGGIIVCCWGKHASLLARGARTQRVLREAGLKLHYLALNGDGSPRHPLYLPDATEPTEWA